MSENHRVGFLRRKDLDAVELRCLEIQSRVGVSRVEKPITEKCIYHISLVKGNFFV
jgi:hypothetical protein